MRKYYAAIAEDQQKSRDYIREHLIDLFGLYHIDVEIDTYASGDELLAAMNRGSSHDIFFLDIEMPGISGMDLAKELRGRDPEAYIIFITNYEDQVFESFAVKPFRFLRKSHFSQEVPAMVKALAEDLKKYDAVTIPIKELHSGDTYNLNVNQIVYAEVHGRYCNIVTTTDSFEFQYKMKDLYELLKEHGFLQPHRSFIVNYRFIDRVTKDAVILNTKEEIPLSRSARTDFQDAFFAMMRNSQ